MKIAFVNQPIDTILPPYQTSVGACTYGLACSLARLCDVAAYGLQDRHAGADVVSASHNVTFRFLPSTLSDRFVYKVRSTSSKFGIRLSPDSTSRWQFPAFGRQVAADLQDQQCDVIHLQHCSQYAPVIRAFNPLAKIVLHLHAEWFYQNTPALLRPRLNAVDLVTTVSDYVTSKTRQAFPQIRYRCETTYNGIDSNEFSREKDYLDSRHREEKLIMYAGAVSPHKGLHVLIDAFTIVVKQLPNVRLNIIGFQGTYSLNETFDTSDRTLLTSLAPFYRKNRMARLKAKLSLAPRDAGTYVSYLKQQLSPEIARKVNFLGLIPRSDLVASYYDADVFAFPSIWDEGFGIPPVEAMAAGVPVVASRSGAVPETVKDGETGFVVDKNDVDGLAGALLTLLKDDCLRKHMGRAGRQRVLENFTWNRVADSMYTRYQGLCATDRRKSSIT
jgi:glycosyltransferase involved in cell wall biosynthesis